MESTIQFADEPVRRTKSKENSQPLGGVYPVRSRSRSRGRKGSFDLPKFTEIENAEDEDAGLGDARDYKQKQVRLSHA
jgi:KUP system potassium uptake protein